MQRKMIGVIVPVYKVEKYIAECIESILAQTYTNFRLILVDDGTPDKAGEICDEYAKKDKRITVIHQENAGVTRARARGVEEATDCEFITFVDGDDTVRTECFETLLNEMKEAVDIVVGHYEPKESSTDAIELENEEYISRLIQLNLGMPHAMWAKLFRRNIFNDFIFDLPREITIGEDAIANIRLATESTKPVVVINEAIYNYRILPDSVSHCFNKSLVYQNDFFKYLKGTIPAEKYKTFLPHIISRGLFEWSYFYRYNSKNVKQEDLSFVKMLKSDIKECNYRLNIYDWIQLHCPLQFIRYISINIRKINNIIKDRL